MNDEHHAGGGVYGHRCPLLCALDIIGGKWKLPIIWFLSQTDHLRFNELNRRVEGVSTMMLTKCLRELEEDGLVTRRQLAEKPLHVEYALAPAGQALVGVLQRLYAWGAEYAKAGRSGAGRRGEERREEHLAP